MAQITHITDAPLPTPDPWAGDPAGLQRCPVCALAEPGRQRCRRCRTALSVQVRAKRPLSLNMINLAVILLGTGPLLLVIAVIDSFEQGPLINPWSLWLAVQAVVQWLAAGGLFMRWRWSWFLAFVVAGSNMLVLLVLQVLVGGKPLLPLAGMLTSLMVLGLLLNVYDEVRIDSVPITLLPVEQWPPTPDAAFNLGVAYSKRGHWYFAARMWQRAVALEHDEGRYRRALGLAYVRLRLLEAAQGELAAAAALMPEDQQTRELQAVLVGLQGTAQAGRQGPPKAS